MRISSKRQISIPKKVMEALDLRPGDEVEFEVRGDTVRLIPVKTLKVSRDQVWFWTPKWQKMEKEADEDLSAGRYREFDELEVLLSELRNED